MTEDPSVKALLLDGRSSDIYAESMADARAWLRGTDKEDRNERERAQRRRPKLVKALDAAITAMGTEKAEREEIRDLLLRYAVQVQRSINRDREDLLQAEIETPDPVEAFLDAVEPRRVISVGKDNADD